MILELTKKELRDRITYMPEILTRRSYNFPDYESVTNNLRELSDLLERIDEVFSMNPEQIQDILGGELARPNDAMHTNELPLPLYLYLDIMAIEIEKSMLDIENLNEEKRNILQKLHELREKAAKLEYDSSFDPNKTISEDTKAKISRSRGRFRFIRKEIEDEQFLTIDASKYVGDEYYYNSSNDSRVHVDSGLVFEEDYNYIRQKRNEAKKEIIAHISKYFKDGTVPHNSNLVFDYLDDKYLDDSICFDLTRLIDSMGKDSISDMQEQFKVFLETEERKEKKRKEEEIEKVLVDEVKEDKVIEENIPKKKGIFSRLWSTIPKQENEETQAALDNFEKEREKQIEQDEEVRNVAIFEKKMIDGQEVLVPLDNNEYKVVKR